MKPCLKPQLSSTTFTTGTRQFVVHEAFERTWCFAGSYVWWFTPITIVMSSPLAGAEMTTFFAPAARCLSASGRSVNRPVLSSTRSTPNAFHGSFSGSLIADTLMGLPFGERLRHIRQPRLGCQRRLRGRVPRPDQQVHHRPSPAAAQGARETLALVVAAGPEARAPQRHRDEETRVQSRDVQPDHRR